MKFEKAVDNIPLINELKRIASAYVIDYRNLEESEIREALKKTGPQYSHMGNIEKALEQLYYKADRDTRVLAPIFIKEVLLNKDDFMCPQKETEDDIIAYQQGIVDRSNEEGAQRSGDKGKAVELFHFVLETAWASNNEISLDEKHLIEKIRNRLKISDNEYRLVEAKLGKYPKADNILHTRTEILEVRRILQSSGIIFSMRDSNGQNYDLIPEEIGDTLRKLLNMEVRRHGYRELLKVKYVRNKAYLNGIIKKADLQIDENLTLEELQETCVELIKPSNVLGGFSPKDGIEKKALSKWCADLKLPVTGTKEEIVQRIIEFYDNLLEREEDLADERSLWYDYFEAFARRDIETLRGQQIVHKDGEIERKFEQATHYLFEKKLRHKPLKMIGSNHADGAVSFRDMIVLWDNKSKGSPVSLKDHIKQFSGYIEEADKKVACFLVIGPSFTPDSALLAMQYQVEEGTTITLINAEDLKILAEEWSQKATDDPFPLGYLIQPGLFNRSLVSV